MNINESLLNGSSPEMTATSIASWALSTLSLILLVSSLVFPLATLTWAFVEGTKRLTPGEVRSWKKTKIFGILSGVAIIGLIVVLVIWEFTVYYTSNLASFDV